MLFVGRAMLCMKKMKAELHEHRYFLERNVERETEHLSKRIALLESCNATLSDRLALAYQEIAMLKQTPQALPGKDMKPERRAMKLYVMNNQAQRTAGSAMQEEWGGHATAA